MSKIGKNILKLIGIKRRPKWKAYIYTTSEKEALSTAEKLCKRNKLVKILDLQKVYGIQNQPTKKYAVFFKNKE